MKKKFIVVLFIFAFIVMEATPLLAWRTSYVNVKVWCTWNTWTAIKRKHSYDVFTKLNVKVYRLSGGRKTWVAESGLKSGHIIKLPYKGRNDKYDPKYSYDQIPSLAAKFTLKQGKYEIYAVGHLRCGGTVTGSTTINVGGAWSYNVVVKLIHIRH